MSIQGGPSIVKKITENIQKLNQNGKIQIYYWLKLQHFLVQNLNVFVEQIGSDADTEQKNTEMYKLIQDSNLLSKSTSLLMKSLVTLSNDDRQLRVQRELLMNDYMAVLNRLQSTQRKAAFKEKAQIKTVTIEDKMLSQDSLSQVNSDKMELQRQHYVNLNEIRERQQVALFNCLLIFYFHFWNLGSSSAWNRH